MSIGFKIYYGIMAIFYGVIGLIAGAIVFGIVLSPIFGPNNVFMYIGGILGAIYGVREGIGKTAKRGKKKKMDVLDILDFADF